MDNQWTRDVKYGVYSTRIITFGPFNKAEQAEDAEAVAENTPSEVGSVFSGAGIAAIVAAGVLAIAAAGIAVSRKKKK